MKYFAFLILAFVLSCNSNPQKQILAKDSTRMIIVDQGDKEMDAAIARGKLTLPNFDSALLSRNSNYTGFAIKVRFAYGENNGEHIWLNEIQKVNEEYVGLVNNEPEYVTDLKLRDTIQINKQDISDWMYFDDDILKGGFTIKLFRARMTPKERAEFDSGANYKFEK